MAISCFAFLNTLFVENQSGVTPDLSQHLRRDKPDSQTVIRAVYYSEFTGMLPSDAELKSRGRNRRMNNKEEIKVKYLW